MANSGPLSCLRDTESYNKRDKKKQSCKAILCHPRKEPLNRTLSEPFSMWIWHFRVNKQVLSQSSMHWVTKRYFRWLTDYAPPSRLCPHKKSWKKLTVIMLKRRNVPYIDIATYK